MVTILERKSTLRAAAVAAVLVLAGWWMYTPEGLLGKADAVGYAVCHRIDLRSFHIGTRPISLCARCTGMYLGAVFSLVYLWIRAPRRGGNTPLKVNLALGALALAFGLDGINSFTHLIPGFPSLYTPNNILRIMTGTGFGIVMAVFLYLAFNQTFWIHFDPRPAVSRVRELGPLILIGAAVAGMVISENPMILYPASLISAGGVLLLLTMIYAVLAVILLKQENFAERPGQLLVPLIIGFTVAVLQVGGADIVRFWLTGTWEGFHFG